AVTPAAAALGNPYSFYRSVGDCAADQRTRCSRCVAQHSCVPVTDLADGEAECAQLAADHDRGFSLVCINLALAIDTVSSCTAGRAQACPQDTRASESFAALANNASFLDDATCQRALDECLAQVFDPVPPPRQPSPSQPAGCGDGGGSSGCDGPSCDQACDGADLVCDPGDCSGGESNGCDGGGGGSSGCDGGDCGDGEDACGGGDNAACDSGDCGGGGGGGGDGGGESCDGGGCEGGGGDCGGGDCGGSDCSSTKHKHRSHGTLIAALWALLPIPFAALIRRRARRRSPAVAPPVEAAAPEPCDDIDAFERPDNSEVSS
ncbi:MAG: hypothetical protein KIT31_41620, partial [Deltaproteobacteria bacterium]|nr:hypothetical protein [Deltaproteobacteria bacterium]